MVVVGLNAKCRCCPAVSFRIIYKERFLRKNICLFHYFLIDSLIGLSQMHFERKKGVFKEIVSSKTSVVKHFFFGIISIDKNGVAKQVNHVVFAQL